MAASDGDRDVPLWRAKCDVERVKAEGPEPDLERLESDGYDALSPEEFYRLKTRGVCSQRTPGLHMIRIRVPGGEITAEQVRGIAHIAETLADGAAHITTRQNLELHSVPSRLVRRAVGEIEATGLTTRSACGHTVRNVMGCTRSGICSEEPFETRATVTALHDFFLTHAAHYNARLPRRINVYVAGCASCMSHAQVNDLGFVAVPHPGEDAFQLWCAGSLGSSPRLAHLVFGFVPACEAVAVAQAVADVYCEHGFRDRPSKARMKYLLAEWGEDRFGEAVLGRLRTILPGARTRRSGALPLLGPDRRPARSGGGTAAQRQPGYSRVEARVPLGDLTAVQLRLLADLADRYADAKVWLTREQNAELHWVRASETEEVERMLRAAGLAAEGAAGLVDVQVCAGTEYCIWGVGDSRGLARDLEAVLTSLVAVDEAVEPLRVHISGCAHGCAQHQTADVGLAAVNVRSPEGGTCEGFELYGGGRLGVDPQTARRLGKVPAHVSPTALVALFARYIAERSPGELFAAFLDRTGADATVALEPAAPAGAPA